jgi:hypothetical protein
MLKPAATLQLLVMVLLAHGAAIAMPPPPPAPLKWTRLAWVCPGRERSSIEFEILAQGDSGYRLRVTELQINGLQVDPATVEGLQSIVARRNYVRLAGGYCERTGELIGVEEMASGADAHESGWRSLFVPYKASS